MMTSCWLIGACQETVVTFCTDECAIHRAELAVVYGLVTGGKITQASRCVNL